MSDITNSGTPSPQHLPVGEHTEGFQELPVKVPPLPENASPEEKDLHWFKHVYQGDKMPQLTLRAVIMGGFLGMVMSAANLYTTLSIGWAFGIAITASVLSFVIWNFVRFCSGKHLSQMTVLENACMASCASAAGYSTGSTIATMFGALVLLHDVPEGTPLSSVKTWDVTPWWVLVIFTLCTGLMGVFLAIPMKRQQINHEQLPFPSGIAAAETLRSLYSASKAALRKAYVLVFALFMGLLIGFLRTGEDVQEAVRFLKNLFHKGMLKFVHIPESIDMHFLDKLYPRVNAENITSGTRHAVGFAFEPSALLIAAGMIVGMRTSVSLILSSLLLYGVVGPKLAHMDAEHFSKASDAVMVAVSDAAKDKTDPNLIAKDAVDAVNKAVEEIKLGDSAQVKRQAQRGAAGGLAEIEKLKGDKQLEAMLDAARAQNLSAGAIEKAARRAVREAEEGPERARSGAAIASAVRMAELKNIDPKPIREAAKKAEEETAKATDKEVGAAILAAVIEAAKNEGVDTAKIEAAAAKAEKEAKANPGRFSAKAARDKAVDLVFGYIVPVNKTDDPGLEKDPRPLKAAVDAVSATANASASTRVSNAIVAAVIAESSKLGLNAGKIQIDADLAAKRAEEGAGKAQVAEAIEQAKYEAERHNADAKPVIDAASTAKLTPDEEKKALEDLVKGIMGGENGAVGTAAANFANAKAIEARDKAMNDSLSQGMTYRKSFDASEEQFESLKHHNSLRWLWGTGDIMLTRWSLWGGTAVMVFSSLMSVALQWRTIVRAFSGMKASSGESAETAAKMAAIEVPGKWMIMGMIPITLAMVWLQIQAFGVSWYAGIIAVAMSFVLSLVASRATGETDTTPIGAMGKVMQLMFAVLAPKNIHANLASAGIAANSASSSADLLTDLKTGYLLGANPRRQFLAQFFGVFFGTIAIVPIWYLMVPTKEKLESFALPSTRTWEAVARVLVKGIGELPPSAVWSIFIGAAIGIILPLVEKFMPSKYRKYMPSAMGIGLAWVMPFQNAYSFFLGAVIALIWSKLHRKSADDYNVPLASGLIAGESLMAAALAILATVVGLLNT